MRFVLFGVVLGLAGCGSAEDPDGENASSTVTTQESGAETPTKDEPPYRCSMADAELCEQDVLLEHDETSDLGFSARDVLDMIQGEYEFDIAWVEPCVTTSECSPLRSCDSTANEGTPRFAIAGTSTTLSVVVEASGAPAIVRAPSVNQSVCATDMRIPAILRISSADGAVDVVQEVDIWSECGNDASVGLGGAASVLGGTLAADISPDAEVEFTFGGTYNGRIWLDTYVLEPNAGGSMQPVLMDEILSDEPCPHDVPREDVLR